jgi:hypothetical protein
MSPHSHLHFALCCGLLAALVTAGAVAADAPAPQLPAAPATSVAQANKPSVSTQATPARPAQARTASAPRAESQPTWAELTPKQQQSLAPLAATWRSLGEGHKLKWLALAQNYHTMPPGEQARLHSRMAEWVALSPQQRNLARLNFAETQRVNPDDKRAKWEAYQNLSPEEKRKLAAGAAAAKPPPPPTAVAVQPVPQQKLARIPKPKKPENTSKIAVAPGRVDNNTLLPQPLAPVQP